MKWKIVNNQNIADIMVKVYGKNEEDLFKNILEAYTNIISNTGSLKIELERDIKITGKDISELILNFIDQLIYLKDVKQLIFKQGKFNLTYTEKGYSLYASLLGQKINKNLPIKIDIKAFTLHKFKVEKLKGGYVISLVFDI